MTPRYGYMVCCSVLKSTAVLVPAVPILEAPQVNPYPCATLAATQCFRLCSFTLVLLFIWAAPICAHWPSFVLTATCSCCLLCLFAGPCLSLLVCPCSVVLAGPHACCCLFLHFLVPIPCSPLARYCCQCHSPFIDHSPFFVLVCPHVHVCPTIHLLIWFVHAHSGAFVLIWSPPVGVFICAYLHLFGLLCLHQIHS